MLKLKTTNYEFSHLNYVSTLEVSPSGVFEDFKFKISEGSDQN